ncbi:unnamed protein product [Amoebophrya sp. A25]|nr:unnamed protein product [Amoebophrya sp. A25]|eukprot:GSA25T00027837001.1
MSHLDVGDSLKRRRVSGGASIEIDCNKKQRHIKIEEKTLKRAFEDALSIYEMDPRLKTAGIEAGVKAVLDLHGKTEIAAEVEADTKVKQAVTEDEHQPSASAAEAEKRDTPCGDDGLSNFEGFVLNDDGDLFGDALGCPFSDFIVNDGEGLFGEPLNVARAADKDLFPSKEVPVADRLVAGTTMFRPAPVLPPLDRQQLGELLGQRFVGGKKQATGSTYGKCKACGNDSFDYCKICRKEWCDECDCLRGKKSATIRDGNWCDDCGRYFCEDCLHQHENAIFWCKTCEQAFCEKCRCEHASCLTCGELDTNCECHDCIW